MSSLAVLTVNGASSAGMNVSSGESSPLSVRRRFPNWWVTGTREIEKSAEETSTTRRDGRSCRYRLRVAVGSQRCINHTDQFGSEDREAETGGTTQLPRNSRSPSGATILTCLYDNLGIASLEPHTWNLTNGSKVEGRKRTQTGGWHTASLAYTEFQ